MTKNTPYLNYIIMNLALKAIHSFMNSLNIYWAPHCLQSVEVDRNKADIIKIQREPDKLKTLY